MTNGWNRFPAESADAGDGPADGVSRPKRAATKLGFTMPHVAPDESAMSRPSMIVPKETIALPPDPAASSDDARIAELAREPPSSPRAKTGRDVSGAGEAAAATAPARLPSPGSSGAALTSDESGARPAARTRVAWIEAALRGNHRRAFTLVPGKLIPGTRYRILRWIGDGGMGVVYEAEHIDIERRVALKILRPEVCEDPEAIQAFRDEARVVGRIGAEQIVDIFDFGELPDGRLMFAMELIVGEPLYKLFETQPLPANRVVGILRQVCKGLAAAHEVGVVHRDIKPDNILIGSRRDRGDAVKILDFGVATILAEHGEANTGMAGTPYYLAPEVISGIGFDARADMYAVGCTAYEMLWGRPPFFHTDIEAALRAHLVEPPTPPDPLPEGVHVPKPLEDVVLRCLEKLPDDRYANMSELEVAVCQAQLEAGLISEWDDLPLPEVEPELRAQLLSGYARLGADLVPRRRSRWIWLSALLVLLLVGTGVIVYLSHDVDETRLAQLDQLVEEARTAASRALFVYPPLDDPSAPTAYALLQEIDALRPEIGRRARSRAESLREDFASTLVRLGDEYWARPGGRGFAIDYYAQALMFDPLNHSANAHVTYTPGQMALMRDKVERHDFTERDLFIAQTLQALAERDPEARARKIAELQEDKERAASTRETLAELLNSEPPIEVAATTGTKTPDPKRGREGARATNAADATATASDAATDATSTGPDPTDVAVETGGVTPPPIAEHPDPTAGASVESRDVSELLSAAQQAMKAGSDRDAQRQFERALARNSKSDEALSGLSDVYFNRGDYDKAVKYARRATRLKPNNASYRFKLGDAYYKVFRYEEARQEYERAERLGHPQAAGRLARVNKKLADAP